METTALTGQTVLTPAQEQLHAFYAQVHYRGGDQRTVWSGAILDTVARMVFRPRQLNIMTSFFAALILTGGLALAHAILQLTLAPGAPPLTPTMLMLCMIGGWAALTAQLGPILGFPTIAQNLPQLLTDGQDVQRILGWSNRVFGLRRQAVFSLGWAALVAGLTYAFFPLTSPMLRQENLLAFSITHGLINLFGGNVLYWGINYPTLWQHVGRSGLRLNRFNPGSTAELQAMGTVTNVYTFVASLVLTSYAAWLNFVAAPFSADAVNVVSLGITALIIVGLVYIFVETHWCLARAIERQKAETIDEIEEKLADTLDQNQALSPAHLEQMNTLLELEERIRESPHTVLSASSIRSLVMSLVLPVVTFIAEVYLD
jgi:hypothetical protein